MPENRIEWGILGAGLVLLAVLGGLIGLSVGDHPATEARATTTATVTKAAAPLTPPVAPAADTITTAVAPPETATATTPLPALEVAVPAAPKPAAPAASVSAPATRAASERPDRPRTQPGGVRLRLTASRGDSWLEVRAGSATGTVLFSGTLVRGATRTFRANRLWIRFGGASNLDARLNGRALGLRFGTYDTLVTAKGLAPPA